MISRRKSTTSTVRESNQCRDGRHRAAQWCLSGISSSPAANASYRQLAPSADTRSRTFRFSTEKKSFSRMWTSPTSQCSLVSTRPPLDCISSMGAQVRCSSVPTKTMSTTHYPSIWYTTKTTSWSHISTRATSTSRYGPSSSIRKELRVQL
jgi:hypothetical protein